MRSYLYRLIWLGSLSICLPIILVSIVYYNTSMNREIKHIQNNNQISLGIIQTYIDNAMFDVVTKMTRLALDPDVYESFLSLDGFARVENNTSILDKVSGLIEQNEFISNIYYYNINTGTILSGTQGNVGESNFLYPEDLSVISKNEKNAMWLYLPDSRQDGYISFVLTLPAMSLDPQGMLVAQVEAEKINSYLSTFLSIIKNESIFVMNAPGMQLFHSEQLTNADIKVGSQIRDTILTRKLNSGNASIDSADGEKFYYSFQKSDSGMIYASVISHSMVAQELRWILWSTILAVIICLALGIFLTLYNSRRAYYPIRQLVDYGRRLSNNQVDSAKEEISFIRYCLDYFNNEVKSLSGWVTKSEPFLIERFMQQLLKGNYISKSSLYEDCEQYDVPIVCTCVVLVVRVEDFGKDGRFQEKDKPLLAYAAMNIMNELLAELPLEKGYVTDDLRGHEIAVLCFDHDAETDTVTQNTRKYAESVHHAMQKYLNIRVSIGIGRPYMHIGDIALSYRDSLLALQFRLFKEMEAILSIDETHLEKLAFPEYPHRVETAIIEALLNEDAAAFEQGIWQFNKIVAEKESYHFIYQSYHVLLALLISTAEKRCGTSLGLLEYDLFDQLRSHQTVEEIGRWFIATLPPLYSQAIKDNNRTVGKTAVQEVCAYIADHVADDISLTECAERVHMNPSYFSRLFKKETGMSFQEYTMKCKMNQARWLLAESDHNISDIAGYVGYSHRSFNRVFQQMFQMTPSEYRKSHR